MSYNPFKVEIPEELVTKKAKVTYWILWQIYMLDLGRGQIFGKFTQLFTEIFAMLLLLDKIGVTDLKLTHVFVIGIIGTFIVWYSGWLYQYHSIDKIGQLVSTKRNPMINDIYDKMKSKRGK